MSKRFFPSYEKPTLTEDGRIAGVLDPTAAQDAATKAYVDVHQTATNAPTGFPNRTDSALSFAGATFTIAPSSTTFDYYIAGVKYTKSSAENIVLADTSGAQLIYYDGSTLSKSVNPNTATIEDILLNKAWVATIYWQTTGAGTGVAPLLADERHGAVMSGETHLWLHNINGAAYSSGLTLSGYTEATDSDAALTFELTNGAYDDEDLEHTIIDGNPTTQYSQQLNGGDASIPIVYKISGGSSGVWVEDTASTLPYKLISAGNRLAYNRDDGGGNWSQQEVQDGKWVSMTLIATNDWQYPIKAIQGQNEYTDKKTAVEEATAEIIAFGGGTLSPEVITLYRFVMQTKDAFSGTKKAKIETDGVTDFRRVTVIGGAAVAVDHGALGGLADDDHAQYLRTDGTRALAGAWDMGSQNLTNVNIDSGTIDGVTITSPNLNEAVALTATATELNLLDLAALTAGELLVATGAATAAWQSTGVVLTAPVLDGTVTNTGAALVLPAHSSGDISLGANKLRTTNHFIADGGALGIILRNAINTAYTDIYLNDIRISGSLVGLDAEIGIEAYTGNDSIVTFKARINDGALAEIAQMRSAADPYFSMGGGQEFKFYNSGIADFGSGATTNVNIDSGTIDGVTFGNITMDGAATVDGVDVSAHAANTTTAHGAVSAATASKHVVRDASARAKFAQSAAAGDAIVADANNRAPDSTLLEGSSKATVQDHTPKAHTAASHSDQGATGAELEELTDGSETALHSHAAAGIGASTGNYTGNNGTNRGIPHGLGVVPKLVLLAFRWSDSFTAIYRILPNYAYIFCNIAATDTAYAVTGMDATNFYVGNGAQHDNTANANTLVYYWSAVG